MLKLQNIVKDYVSGNNVTHALKGISINFRQSEFVSVLGASGCGKTTTLNIIGGLDRYTSGDLLINSISTKDYTDRDWDTYRNHSIGFVFQTYNLISHQSIAKNVELALTISGVSKDERKRRAYEALKRVGLEGMERKKPNQLSGGQCQRVAIARALINNPEILLADEPTGALDSETSIQIMELLKEVASDRLVIMVTHNPDLAEKYSTRIVRMSDGLLIGDTNPFDGEKSENTKENTVILTDKGSKKKTSMSLKTATGLSLANLVSKMKRTVLVTIAGSIGIIGVSAVLAVSRGVKDYIGNMQNDMLSSYPIEIAEESVDYTSLITGLSEDTSKKALEFDPSTQVGVDSMINYLMSTYSNITNVKTNKINDNLLSYIDNAPANSTATILKNYGIDVTNNIFGNWKQNKDDAGEITSLNGLTQTYIAELNTVDGFKSYASYVNLFTNFMYELPNNSDYIFDQYDVIKGDASNLQENDLVLVVDRQTTLTDLLLAQMGVYNHDDFIKLAKKAIKENEINSSEDSVEVKNQKLEDLNNDEEYQYDEIFEMDDLVGRKYYYYPHSEIYTDTGVIANAETTITFISVVEDGSGDFYKLIYLTYNEDEDALVGITMDASSETTYIGAKRFGSTKPDSVSDPKDILNAVWVGASLTGSSNKTFMIDNTTLSPTYSEFEGSTLTFNAVIDPSINVETKDIKGYHYPSVAETTWTNKKEMNVAAILRIKDDRQFGCLERGLYYTNKFAEQYMKDANDAPITKDMKKHIGDEAKLSDQTAYDAYVTFNYYNHDPEVDSFVSGYATSLNGTLSSSFSDLFSSLTGVNYEESNLIHLRAISGLKGVIERDDDGAYISCDFEKLPQSIYIYPKSFDDKDIITDYLDKWNSDETLIINNEELKAKDRDVLTYTDTIELIVAVINTFINAITVALVVFTSLSLVVSCFMIAVITYISVVERIKEIGVIRSLGGRKRDVANLFVMETLLTGLFSGVFGIGITYVLELIINIILKVKFNLAIVNLTIPTALLMIGVSIFLSVMSGLIPSQSAAHKDPVVALRSNE